MSSVTRRQYDIIIVGAGMIGLSTACLLAKQGYRVVLIEKHSQPQLSDELALRVSALNGRSRQVLKDCGVWQAIWDYRTGPYYQMSVWDKDSPAHIEFSAADVNADDLGLIVENNVVEHFLWDAAEAAGVTIRQADDWQLISAGGHTEDSQPAEVQVGNDLLTAQLLIGADGGRSSVRAWAELPVTFWDYQQQGIVANIRTELPHNGVARQVFLPSGPLALLPTSEANVVSIVWSADNDRATQLLNESKQRFGQFFTAESGRILGQGEVISDIAAFPLRMQYAREWIHQRIVLMGDAAHTIHPLAGQGANLGFGDVTTLIDRLGQLKDTRDLKSLATLHRQLRSYCRERKAETQMMIAAMETFKRGFGTANPVIKGLRALAFALPNKVTPLKRQLAKVALGETR